MTLEERMQVAERLIEALFQSHEQTQSELRTLAKSQVFLTEAARNLTEAARKTEEKLAETTDKLDALISIVEQHLRDHGNGNAFPKTKE